MTEKHDINAMIVDHDTFDVRQISSIIRPMLSSIVDDVIKSYALNLLLEDDNFIVQAVWGPMKGVRLDQVQCDINNRIDMFVSEIRNLIMPNWADSAQEFAIEFLIRERILFNISFLLERGRRLAMIKNDPANSDEDLLEATFNAFAGRVGNA